MNNFALEKFRCFFCIGGVKTLTHVNNDEVGNKQKQIIALVNFETFLEFKLLVE